jgi:RNA-directed DNA polymerase
MLLEQISQRLLLPPKYIGNLAAGASHHYKAYEISKKRGGTRLIEHPSKPLKAVQRRLATNVISHFPSMEQRALIDVEQMLPKMLGDTQTVVF